MSATAIQFLRAVQRGEIVFDLCDVSKAKGFLLEETHIKNKESASPAEIIFTKIVLTALGNLQLPISLKIFRYKVDDPPTEGLKYEIKIYQRIIEKIIARNQSPNFVGYVASACCPMRKGIYADTAFSMFRDNYCILATEKVGNGSYFGYAGELPVDTLWNLYSKLSDKDKKAVLLQLCYSLELLQRYRIVHNDLHAGNVLVMILPEPVILGFDIDGKKYKVETKYIPYLFDWDQAYCEVFGNNPKLERSLWYNINVFNKFNKKNDLYTLLCTLRENIPNIMKQIELKKLEVKLSPKAVDQIYKFKPLFKDKNGSPYYRLGRAQVIELLGEEYKTLSYATISLKYGVMDTYAVFYVGHGCRPANMDYNMDTPLSYIDKNLKEFAVNSFEEIKIKYTYTMPAEEKRNTIFIDPLLARRGREALADLGVKPRFPLPQKSGLVKIKKP